MALAHNGNLVNAGPLRDELLAAGVRIASTSDTEVIAALLGRDPAPLPDAVAGTVARLEGAYSIVAIADGTLVAFRDPLGIRPLTLGRIGDDWVVASETCALDLVGADVVRDVLPGEVVWVDADGSHSAQAVPRGGRAACIFEQKLVRAAVPHDRRKARGDLGVAGGRRRCPGVPQRLLD